MASITRELTEYLSKRQEDVDDKNEFDDKTNWENPIPFDEYDLPPFPINSLPYWFRAYVEAVAEDTQTPIDLSSVIGLVVLSTTVANKAKIQGKHGWHEPLNLYTLSIMRPAERKSSVFNHMVKPILEYESETNKQLAPEIAKSQTEKKILEDTVRNLQTQASKSESPEKKQQALEKAEELAFYKEVRAIRLLADDVSPEKISALLAENGGKIAIMSAEGGIFEIMAGRYSQSGSINIDVFLKGHSGDMLRIDRIGRQSEHIEEPCLMIGLAIQPDILNGIMNNSSFRGRGLTARFLFSLPKSKVGERKIESSPIPEDVKARYFNNLKKLLSLNQPETPHILKLSDEAMKISFEFAKKLEPRLIDDLETIGDWAGKLHGAVLRIAGILHMAELIYDYEPWEKEISEDAIKKAIIIGEYFIAHAKAAFSIMGANKSIEDAKYILKWVKRQNINEFSKRDVFRGSQRRFKTVDEIEPLLEMLIEYNYIQEKEIQYEGNGRRPNNKYVVNPALFKEDSGFVNKNSFVNGIPDLKNDFEEEYII